MARNWLDWSYHALRIFSCRDREDHRGGGKRETSTERRARIAAWTAQKQGEQPRAPDPLFTWAALHTQLLSAKFYTGFMTSHSSGHHSLQLDCRGCALYVAHLFDVLNARPRHGNAASS